MKYAFIVMLAVYLVTFGCNPKSEDETTPAHDTTEKASVEHTPATPAPPQNVQQVKIEGAEHAVKIAPPAHVVEVKTAAEPAEEVASEEQAAVAEPENQWKAIANSAALTVLALMNSEEKEQAQPVAKIEESPAQQPEVISPAIVVEQPAEVVTEPEEVLPCGKKVADGQAPPPCMKHHAPVAQQPAAPAEATELSEAMQKMVDATNNMVMITRQLVMATQQMLSASKDVAVEVIDTGKEAMDAPQPAVENSVNEQELIDTVKEVVSATKEAFEATSQALSEALEAKDAKPVQEAAPQQ